MEFFHSLVLELIPLNAFLLSLLSTDRRSVHAPREKGCLLSHKLALHKAPFFGRTPSPIEGLPGKSGTVSFHFILSL